MKDNLKTDAIRGSFRWDPETRKMVEFNSPRRKQAAAPVSAAYISDEMPPTEFNGKVYTSRSRYKAEIEAHGYRLTEGVKDVASQSARKSDAQKQAEIQADLERAYYMVRDGNAPLSEKEKERCKRQNELLNR